jgi:hypothetical protein
MHTHTHINPLHNLQFLCHVFTNPSKGDYSAPVARWLTLHRWTLNWLPLWIWTHLQLNSSGTELNYPEYYQSRAI